MKTNFRIHFKSVGKTGFKTLSNIFQGLSEYLSILFYRRDLVRRVTCLRMVDTEKTSQFFGISTSRRGAAQDFGELHTTQLQSFFHLNGMLWIVLNRSQKYS